MIDRTAVMRSAVTAAVLFGAAAVVLALVTSGDGGSGAWIVLVLLFLFVFSFAGWSAAYDRPPRPLVHGTLAATIGCGLVLVVALVVQAASGDLSGGAIVAAVVFLELAATLGILGALLATRGARVQR